MPLKPGPVLVLALCAPLTAHPIISSGAPLAFVTPDPPYAPEEVRFSMHLGYGTPETTIGDGVWFTEAGLYDLSMDPDLGAFLGYAANGTADEINVTVADGRGGRRLFRMGRVEGLLLGSFPDLAGLQVTGMLLEVIETGAPAGGVAVRWHVTGVPDPTTGVLFITGAFLLTRRRAGCDPVSLA